MIRRAKSKYDLKGKLCNQLISLDAYAIDSCVDKSTVFIATEEEFAIVRQGDALICEVREMPQLAVRFIEPIRDEIMEIYEDIKDLKRMDISYASRYKGDMYIGE